jgi:hypothetical protein
MAETGLEFRSLAVLVGVASSREYYSTYVLLRLSRLEAAPTKIDNPVKPKCRCSNNLRH